MANLSDKLTKRLIDMLTRRSARYVVWDSELKGFGVRVEVSGRKSFLVRYRAEGGGRRAPLRQLTLGSYDPLTPDQARKMARDALAAVRNGEDPVHDRHTRRAASDVTEAVRFYIEDYGASAKLSPATLGDARSVLDRHALPAIGRMKIAEVTTADVRRLHRATLDASGPYQANKMVRFLSKAMSLAVEDGHRADNPCKGVKPFPEEKRERYLSDDEAGRFLAALDRYADQGAANALRLLLFTGARLREVLHATWDQFDLERGVWIKPSAHTKQRRTHRLDLGGPALDVLSTMREADPDGTLLFPGSKADRPRSGLQRPWAWVKAQAGLAGIRLHDLRHSLASFMVAEGVSLPVIGRQLGHTQAQTTARYAHVADRTQRDAAHAVGLRLVELGRRPPAKVVQLNSPRVQAAPGEGGMGDQSRAPEQGVVADAG